MTLLILLLLVVLLAWASQRWGIDSRDNIDSAEWKRRRDYRPHHHV